MTDISPLYQQTELIINNLNSLDTKHYSDLTEEVYEYLSQIRFAVEEIQSIEKFKRNVPELKEQGKGS
tara:strand:- start:1153 stop:1356 length:204 start_codon:yes stop_codon:yes gene_type:complete